MRSRPTASSTPGPISESTPRTPRCYRLGCWVRLCFTLSTVFPFSRNAFHLFGRHSPAQWRRYLNGSRKTGRNRVKESGNLRVGLFGIGLAAYWEQFPGLEERLKASVRVVEEQLRAPGREVVNLGLIDSSGRGLAAGHGAPRHDVDLLVLYVTTYALSSTVLPLARRAKVPILVLNLQPGAAIDYKRFNALPGRTQ